MDSESKVSRAYTEFIPNYDLAQLKPLSLSKKWNIFLDEHPTLPQKCQQPPC